MTIVLTQWPLTYLRVMEVEDKHEVASLKHDQLVRLVGHRHVLSLALPHPVKLLLKLVEGLVEVLQL